MCCSCIYSTDICSLNIFGLFSKVYWFYDLHQHLWGTIGRHKPLQESHEWMSSLLLGFAVQLNLISNCFVCFHYFLNYCMNNILLGIKMELYFMLFQFFKTKLICACKKHKIKWICFSNSIWKSKWINQVNLFLIFII